MNNKQIAMRVSIHTIIGNGLLSAFKLAAGILGNSVAMISDAVHSFSDVLSTGAVMVGVHLANKASDRDHPYGHERLECVVAVILSIMLLATGLGIGYGGLQRVLQGNAAELAMPGVIALVAAVLSIVVKESMYWYKRAAAKRINSSALMADAWHHRSDALSSIGSFAGILGARLGFPVLDSVACIVICAFILKAAADIFMDAIGKMTDKACDDAFNEEVSEVIRSRPGVLKLDVLRTRQFASRIYVDVEILADRNAPLHMSHAVAQSVHDAIEQQFPLVKHCMVHVNPSDETAG